MNKIGGINDLTSDELEDLNDALDKWSFEKYCNACYLFKTEECPHIDKFYGGEYYDLTEWKKIPCDKFDD